jgi:penicillin-binding protein A
MKYWPAVVSATVALAVAIPVLHELVPNLRLFERAEASVDNDDARGQVGTPDALAAVEIDRMFLGEDSTTAPAGAGRIAHLTVDPRLQKASESAMKSRRIPIGGAVVMDLRTGEVLAYAAKRSGNAKEDPLTSTAPATDIFKVVTATALINMTGARADTRVCHRDPGKALELDDLIEDGEKDIWCPPLGEALARNLDAPFARASYRKLSAAVLDQTAQAYGFGTPIPFDLEVEPSTVEIPDTELGLVEASIGAGHASLTAIQGLVLASTIASKGVLVQPTIVRSIEEAGGKVVYRAPTGPRFLRRAINPLTAGELSKMMLDTTEIGDGFRAFHDDTGHPVLGDFKAAGKTGADREKKASSQTTWFIGFAPVSAPEVAIVTVTRNRRGASGNATVLAADVLRAYFEPRMKKPEEAKPDES